jgi:hypothetical protein
LLAVAQQSPLAQQNPFWQWPLSHWDDPLHVWPSGFFARHWLASQYALLSHWASLSHRAEHAGWLWSSPPLHDTAGYSPHSFATVAALHAESSGASSTVRHTKPVHAATSRLPWQDAGKSHVAAPV